MMDCEKYEDFAERTSRLVPLELYQCLSVVGLP